MMRKALVLLLLLAIPAMAQVSYAPMVNAKIQFLDSSGHPLSGGKLYTYTAGTTTAKATYSATDGTTNSNPVILDSGGYATVFLGAFTYKFVLKNSSDVTQWTIDNITSLSLAAYTNQAGTWTANQTGPWIDKGGLNYDVRAYGAKCDGSTDDSTAFSNAIVAASATTSSNVGGVVTVPAGRCKLNITISRSNVSIRGRGRRATFLIPAANSPVITLSSASNAVQGATIEDIGFDNTGTGFTSSAILISGTNINDWHLFERLFIFGGFTKSISVTGRTIWTSFENVEVNDDVSNGIDITSSGAVNAVNFHKVRVAGSAGKGMNINSSSPTFANISITDSNFENNTGDGITACNVDGFEVHTTYIENNGGNSITFPNTCTYARGIDISGNFIWGATGSEIVIGAGTSAGSISGNFLATNATLVEQANWTSGIVYAYGNHDAGTHTFTADANGLYHLSVNGSRVQTLINASGSMTPSVLGINAIRFTNTVAATVTNFTDGEPGQIVQVINEGSSTVAFSHSSSGGIYTTTLGTVTLAAGQSATFYYSPASSRWVMQYNNGPLGVSSIQVGSAANSTLTQLELKNAVVGCATAASAGSVCTTAVTWSNAFADTNYVVNCIGVGITSGIPLNGGITNRTTTAATFQTVAGTAAAAQYGTIECSGFHP